MQSSDLGYKFKRINECFRANGNAHAKALGLTHVQMSILFYLFSHSEGVTQKDIEKDFGIKHSTVNGILGRMEKNGFIEISVCETDRRQRSVMLLPKAIDIKLECEARRTATESRLTERLTDEQLKQLLTLLDIVYNTLKEEHRDD